MSQLQVLDIANSKIETNFSLMSTQQQKQQCRSLTYTLPPVSIPQQLIEAIDDYGTKRFLKVEKPIKGEKHTGKAAFEPQWQNNLYEPDDPELQKWLQSGGNYGLAFGNGLIGIDADDPLVTEKIADIKSFSIKSGRVGGGKHLLLQSDLRDNITLYKDIKKKDKERENIGHIQVNNKYLVAPNSRHNSWNLYTITDDTTIVHVNKDVLKTRLGDYYKSENNQKKAANKQAKQENELVGNQIPITELIDISDFTELRPNEYQGEHPIHGSSTGQNFCVNTQKNSWYCFRCGSGGGALLWLLVKNEIIDCVDAGSGLIRGEMFQKALELAEAEGYEIDTSNPKIAAQIATKYFKTNKRGQPTDKFIPARLGEDLMEQNTYLTRIKDKKIFRYNKNTGIYDEHGDVDIQQKVAQILGEEYKQHRVNETKSYIQANTYRNLDDTPLHLIALENGLLNINTMQLEPFSPQYFILNSHPITYDQKATCPRWQQFLTEVINEPDDIKVLQEWFGYSFYRDYTFKHGLIVQGGTDAGKTTALNVLHDIVGETNSASVTLQDLHKNRFTPAELYKKTVNVSDDISSASVKDMDVFKQLTGKSPISAEYKHQTGFQFQNYAKLTFSANRPPTLENADEATINRIMYIIFPNSFPKDHPKRDNNLDKKLKTEHQGIFNWAIEGLRRLLKNSKFTRYRTIEETEELHHKLSEPTELFLEEHTERDCQYVITVDDLHQVYLTWGKQQGITSLDQKIKFGKKVKQIMGVLNKNHKRKKCWIGLKLTNQNLNPNPEVTPIIDTKNQPYYTENNNPQQQINIQPAKTVFGR